MNPGAEEIQGDGIDQDCDGTDLVDADGDGHIAGVDDCDDADPAVNPGATEVCDGVDNDCSGDIDDGAVCPFTVQNWGGHAYMYCTSTIPWADAEIYCASYGYYLVSYGSAAEHEAVNDAADAISTNVWWIGFDDQAVEGDWVWDSGEPMTYDGWYPGKPNGGTGENCAVINFNHPELGWNDVPCWWTRRCICEAG